MDVDAKVCVICQEVITDSAFVQIRIKGSEGINYASRQRGDNINTQPGDFVHSSCRKSYTNPFHIQKTVNTSDSQAKDNKETVPVLRSQNIFTFSEHCLFCGKTIKYNNKKRGNDAFPVRTSDFQRKVVQICKERNDEWASEVLGRLESINDLHAADAMYHQTCNVNFRTLRNVPQAFSPDEKRMKKSKGRPSTTKDNFMEIVEYLKENEEEQLTIPDLVSKMAKISGDAAYSPVYMKKKLLEYFGDELLISEISGKPNVVTLRRTAKSILHDFYNIPNEKADDGKMDIIRTAAKLILSDIKSIPASRDVYPASSDISSMECNVNFVPESLQSFLKVLFSEKDSALKVASIGQAMMQAARPRILIPPLQLALGVQLNHHFGSRFLIDICHHLGFCSPYAEVHRFATSAAASQGTSIQGLLSGCCLQFVADNVDHNVCTLDGTDTFHGMGIIAGVTPGTYSGAPIRRKTVTTDDLKALGKIDIKFYRQPTNRMSEKCFDFLNTVAKKDLTFKFDQLTRILYPLRSPMPGWSGLMHMIQKGTYPGKSAITFLPMIDMNPSDMSCIFSTLHFICSLAQQHNKTPVVTFDQPLYWKAISIKANEEDNSSLKSMIIRLGGFHLEMSYLGAIGNIMAGSGLQQVLERVYAPQAVTHILSGKAVARAVRGHMLVDMAIHAILASSVFGFQFQPQNYEKHKEHDMDQITCSYPLSSGIENSALNNVAKMYEKVIGGDLSVESLCQSEALDNVLRQYTNVLHTFGQMRTASLWLQYSEMVQLLRSYIKAERTGDWELHLKCIQDILPYLAAAGHNLYTKSAYVYLSEMRKLESDHPDIYREFVSGYHVLRRTDKYWAGLSCDLVIEQELMRSVKSSGGLTRGRGIGETQRAQWLLSMPQHADMNNAMQILTGVGYCSSEQHKETSSSRQARDCKDIRIISEFISDRDPFTRDPALRNIESGQIAEEGVNQDQAKDIGKNIIASMASHKTLEYTFKRSLQISTMSNSIVKVEDDTINVDPQLLFQRLMLASSNVVNDPADLFQYELSSFPSSIFDSSGLPRVAQKSALADAIWDTGSCGTEHIPDDVITVLDGGSFLQKLPWKVGDSFSNICESYVEYSKRRYSSPVIVFDGYGSGSTIKDVTHMRRGRGVISTRVDFTQDMPLRTKKDVFLANEENKQSFIYLLGSKLQEHRCTVVHANDDADLLIVQTAINCARIQNVEVIGEDTDLLVLLCHHYKCLPNIRNIYFRSDRLRYGNKAIRLWDIQATKKVLGDEMCSSLLALHALTGCDSTSRLFGIGKGQAFKTFVSNTSIRDEASIFLDKNIDVKRIVEAGEHILVKLYGGVDGDNLNTLRYRKFILKARTGKTSVQVSTLPPTTDSAKYHIMRSYFQCQQWLSLHSVISPEKWGWVVKNMKLTPIRCGLPPAPESLLRIIRCSCRSNCDSKRCSCRKNGLECSNACKECKGVNCSNSVSVTFSDLTDDI